MQPQTAPESKISTTAIPATNGGAKAFLWGSWVVYVGYLLLSEWPPGESLLHTRPETLQMAMDLSLNFWFVMPMVVPHVTPVLHPALEALFNIVVAWGLLLWGFAIDGRQQRVPIVPFLVGTAFLTNVFYLPWLAIRWSNPIPPQLPLTRFETVAESRVWPSLLLGVFGVSLVWGAIARPEFGDLSARWIALVDLVKSDRLAYSFFMDLLVFWVFQSWLVKDDMARRQWHSPSMLWLTRLLPFLGLVIYFLRRPRLGGDRRCSSELATQNSKLNIQN